MEINLTRFYSLTLVAGAIFVASCKDLDGSASKTQNEADKKTSELPPAEIRNTPASERGSGSSDQSRTYPYTIDTQSIRIETEDSTKRLRIVAEPGSVRGDASTVKELEATAWIVSAEAVSKLFTTPFLRPAFSLEATRVVAVKVNGDGSFSIPLNSTLTQQQDRSIVITFGGIHDIGEIHLGSGGNLIWSIAKFSAASLDFELLSRPAPFGSEAPSKTIRGAVWYLAPDGVSCSQQCERKGNPVLPELSFADTSSSRPGCEEVARAFGSIGTPMSQAGNMPLGCALSSSLLRALVSPPGSAKPESAIPGLRRICGCEP